MIKRWFKISKKGTSPFHLGEGKEVQIEDSNYDHKDIQIAASPSKSSNNQTSLLLYYT